MTESKSPCKLAWLRWCAYLIATAAFIIAIQREPICVIPIALDTADRYELTAPPEPTQCAFGHKTLSRISTVQGISEGEDAAEHQRKIDALEIWDIRPPGICPTFEGLTKLVCKTCRFAYDEAFSTYAWAHHASYAQSSKEQYFLLSELVLHAPHPNSNYSHGEVAYSQTAKHGQILEETCSYWTNEPYDKIVSQFTSYLSSRGINAVAKNQNYSTRTFYQAYAQVGLRYLKLEIMRESNAQVHVRFETLSPSRAHENFHLCQALNIPY